MTTFLIIAVALALIAPLFIAVPLLKRPRRAGTNASAPELKLSVYRDQLVELAEDRRGNRLGEDEYVQARGELEHRVLEEMHEGEAPATAPTAWGHRAAAVAAMVAVPLLALLLYLPLGNLAGLRPQQGDDAHGLGQQQIDAMVARLATRLEKNPQDVKGWVMLARAQAVLGHFEEASAAYAKSVELVPDDAQLLADYADALAMAQGARLAGEPEKLIERALRVDPNNAKALSLAGTVAYDNRDFALAVKYWERLRSSIPANSEFAESIQRSIDEAKRLAQSGGAVRPAGGAAATARASEPR
jgi:cytochrome c-type biogenesis protein CcmH